MSAQYEGRLPRDARVLVTGGAGFIGSHLANSLVAQGARVRVLEATTAGELRSALDDAASAPDDAVFVRVQLPRDDAPRLLVELTRRLATRPTESVKELA